MMRARTNISRPLLASFLLIAELLLGGCDRPSPSETSGYIDGIWNTKFFGKLEVVLKLERGDVYAYCHGDVFSPVQLGTYSLHGNSIDMHLRFDADNELDLSGLILSHGETGFLVRVSQPHLGASLIFEQYAGDCSEVRGIH